MEQRDYEGTAAEERIVSVYMYFYQVISHKMVSNDQMVGLNYVQIRIIDD